MGGYFPKTEHIMQQMTITLGLNERNMLPTLITIKSIMDHTNHKQNISFALFSDKMNDYALNIFETLLSGYGYTYSIIKLHDILSGFIYEDIICDDLLYPLLIPQYFTSKDLVLSLGTHSFVQGDILTLLENFPADKKIGAVRCMMHGHKQYSQFYGLDHEAEHLLKLDNPRDYFSRNLLLFNRRAIAPIEGQACIQLLDEGWRARDEAILNRLFQQSCHLFPQEWNIQMELFHEPADAFHDPIAQELARSRHSIKLCQFSAPLDPESMTTLPEQTNDHVQEYRNTATAIMQDIRQLAPPVMFGSMWNKLHDIM